MMDEVDTLMNTTDALRWICNEALSDDTFNIDEDRYCYGLDVLHAHEIESSDGKLLIKYKYIGSASRSGPFKGTLRTHLPLEKGHQFRWRWGVAEVVSSTLIK